MLLHKLKDTQKEAPTLWKDDWCSSILETGKHLASEEHSFFNRVTNVTTKELKEKKNYNHQKQKTFL